MASGWFIDDIELEIAPDTDERNISRSFQSETLFNFFPALTKSTARAFDYTIKGIVFPERIAFQIDQIAKSADTNVVTLTIPPDQNVFGNPKYAVKSLVMSRKGPLFVRFLDKDVVALRYTLTFTQLPDEGEFQEGIDGFTDADEGALGLQQFNELVDTLDSEFNIDDYGPLELHLLETGVQAQI